jgi:hypothetical protein
MRFVILVLCFLALQQAPVEGHPGGVVVHVGPVNREIADSSPVAKGVIALGIPAQGTLHKVAIHFEMDNLTTHALHYSDTLVVYDVKNIKTGLRAPETAFGCSVDFFSDCHTIGSPMRPGSVNHLDIPPGGSFKENHYIDASYYLEAGEYNVIGYACAAQREGPECFKTNTINITVK